MDAAHRAVAWMLLASIAFGSGSALVKWTAGQAGVATVIFGRSLVITLALLTWSQLRGASLYVGNRRRMLWRCTVGLSAMTCYFYAVQQIPLSNAVTLQYTAPLFVALFSGAMLRERVSSLVYGCIALSFVGTVLIVSPSLRSVDIDALVALISGVLSAFAYLAVRGLRTSATPDGVVFWFALFCTLATLPLAASELPRLALSEVLAITGVGICAGVGQTGMTRAYQAARAAYIGAFSYATVLVGGIYGWLLFHQTLVWGDALGAALIVGSGALLVSSAPNAKPSGELLP
ncbi:MAG: DMT family transporter [Candidatus Thermoplasmatota archaeon]|nr:DMT family transporter [Candidatus Thermoplasmatota archaeon]